jgi:hypothetical protein
MKIVQGLACRSWISPPKNRRKCERILGRQDAGELIQPHLRRGRRQFYPTFVRTLHRPLLGYFVAVRDRVSERSRQRL